MARKDYTPEQAIRILPKAAARIESWTATKAPTGHALRWATDRRPRKRSCRQPVACPTLRSVQPTGWPILPERNSRVGVAVGGRPDPAVCRRCGFLLRLER